MLKPYNIRLDTKDIKKLDQMPGIRTHHIRNAIQQYIQPPPQKTYDNDVIQVFQKQIDFLQDNNKLLQERIDYLIMPWYQKLLLPKQKK